MQRQGDGLSVFPARLQKIAKKISAATLDLGRRTWYLRKRTRTAVLIVEGRFEIMALSPRANAPPTLFPGGAHPRRPPGFVGRGGAGKHSKSLPLKRAGDLSGADFAPMWWRRMDSNHRRQSQQIYSLSPLATWVLLRIQLGGRRWSWWTDSNPRPADYKSAALPAELHQRRSLPHSQRSLL